MVAVKRTKGDRVFDTVNYVILGIIMLLCAYPIWYVFISSISNPFYVNNGQVLFWPKGITWTGYITVFQQPMVLTGYRNTIFYTVFGTLLALAVTLPAAYAVSRRDFVGRKVLTIIFTFTMFFSGGMIPSYLVIQKLHLINSPLTLIILGSVSAYNLILCRAFFENSIPGEIQDAAEIDGCSNFNLFVRVVLPLSKPIIAVMVLFIAVSKWNSYFTALLYITKDNLKPLQLVLYDLLVASQSVTQMISMGAIDANDAQKMYDMQQLIRYSLIITASIPVMCLYPLVQKYFVKGIMLGAVKG
jgi:putative aldouronate transport system permease protein